MLRGTVSPYLSASRLLLVYEVMLLTMKSSFAKSIRRVYLAETNDNDAVRVQIEAGLMVPRMIAI